VSAYASRYDLRELCEEAGVTARTVRYYIQQGLLRSPGSPGPGPKYDEGHLKRLYLIRRLQKEHLPLAEIRKRLGSLKDREIEQLLRKESGKRKTTAVEYIRDVLKSSRPTGSTTAVAAARASLKRKGSAAGKTSTMREHSQWERIAVDPDVEVHVRRPLSRDQRRKLDLLLASANEIFEEV